MAAAMWAWGQPDRARSTMSCRPRTVRRALGWDTRTSLVVKTSDISTEPGGSLCHMDRRVTNLMAGYT